MQKIEVKKSAKVLWYSTLELGPSARPYMRIFYDRFGFYGIWGIMHGRDHLTVWSLDHPEPMRIT